MNHLLSNTKSRIVSRALQALVPSGFYFRQQGYCSCCRSKTYFVSLNSWLRDNFQCSNCGSIPRNRALIQVLQKYYPNWKDLAIHESSPSGGGASALIRRHCAHYIASQYYPMHPLGSIVGEYRNEDLERQTYADGSFDVVITQDVMEHVYDPSSAFREIARTLRPGGSHIFSVPLVNKHQPTQVWATRNPDGSPNFLNEPDYHGNPVDPRGSPVTMRWGYDIAEYIKRASGFSTCIETIDDVNLGIRAEYIEILVTQKPVSFNPASLQNAP